MCCDYIASSLMNTVSVTHIIYFTGVSQHRTANLRDYCTLSAHTRTYCYTHIISTAYTETTDNLQLVEPMIRNGETEITQ